LCRHWQKAENSYSMTIQEIKQSIDAGKTVQWASPAYRVIKDDLGQYLIKCLLNDYCIGLTNRAGDKLNGEEWQFTVVEQ
jgi:hypothetical protein